MEDISLTYFKPTLYCYIKVNLYTYTSDRLVSFMKASSGM
jgi:hypothetical protein